LIRGQPMKKKHTNNVLFFSSLAIILYTTAKASEDKENITSKPHLKHQIALDDFRKGITKLIGRFETIRNQQKEQEEINCKSFWSEPHQEHNQPGVLSTDQPLTGKFFFCLLANNPDKED